MLSGYDVCFGLVTPVFFFFFKQKTAYEMRISDWSSDVCSSDLNKRPWNLPQPNDRPAPAANPAPARIAGRAAPQAGDRKTIVTAKWWDAKGPRTIELGAKGQAERSEEHTSELQSLMRISYAVFCLKKKRKNTPLTSSYLSPICYKYTACI